MTKRSPHIGPTSYTIATEHPFTECPKWKPKNDAPVLVTIDEQAASQLMTWWLGDQETEWSCLAMVEENYTKEGYTAKVGRLFFCDAGFDRSASTEMPEAWLNKVWSDIEKEGLDLAKLSGHIHSHGKGSAYHSSIDDRMIATMLDEQSALLSRPHGHIMTIVVGNNLALDCNLSRWRREEEGDKKIIKYERWQLPIEAKWPASLQTGPILAFSQRKIERVAQPPIVKPIKSIMGTLPHEKTHSKSNVLVWEDGRIINTADDPIIMGTECVFCGRPLFKSELLPPYGRKEGICRYCLEVDDERAERSRHVSLRTT